MSHMIDTTIGRAAFAYRFGTEPAWHKLGQMAPENATLDQWLDTAALNFNVSTVPVAFKPNGHWHPADDYRAVVRDDTGHLFQIASDRYVPLQPRDNAAFLFSLAETHGMEIETMGGLSDGARIWGLANNAKGIKLPGDDEVKPYLLAVTSYDGSMARTWKYVATRVVCHNTLTIGMGEVGGVVKVRNTSAHNDDIVRQRLGLVDEYFGSFGEKASKLASARPTRAQVDKLLLELFGKADDATKPVARNNLTTQSRNVIGDVERQIVCSPGSNLDSSRGTAWGVLNGVTAYVDHGARARSLDNRITSAFWGKGEQIKTQAMDWLLQECCNLTVSPTLDSVINATMQ